MQYAYCITLYTLMSLVSAACYAPALTITASGLYELGEDITFSPGASDSIILIQASDVTLDLGNRIIQQGDATAGVDGIIVAGGLTNVVIKNGTIRFVTGRGIAVGSGTSLLTIDTITVANAGGRGISLEGGVGLDIDRTVIQNCKLLRCASSSTVGDRMLNCTGCRTLLVQNCLITGQAGFTYSGAIARSAVYLENCLNITCNNITIEQIVDGSTGIFSGVDTVGLVSDFVLNNILIRLITKNSAAFRGINIASTANSGFISNCRSFDILASNGGSFILDAGGTGIVYTTCSDTRSAGTVYTPFSFTGTAARLLISCTVQNCSSSAGAFAGFSFASQTGSVILDCICNQNTATTTIDGFLLTTCTRCNLVRCISTNNTSTGGGVRAAGYRFQQCTQCSCTNSIAAGNSAPTLGSGFYITSNSTDCCFRGNSSYRNGVGSVTSTGFETDVGGTGTNGFTENAALRNGNAAANQFLNFTAAMRVLLTVTNTNAAAQPWTNVALT